MGEYATTADCGVFDIRINRDGLWFYHGSPIGRKELVKLFASVLTRDAAGRYLLETPAERGVIQVEDAPFVAVELTREGEGPRQKLIFRTNIDEIVTADREHPLRVSTDEGSEEPKPYVMLRPGIEARLARPVFYELVELGEERGEMLGVWSCEEFFLLGPTAAC
jgi:hypothetical protein